MQQKVWNTEEMTEAKNGEGVMILTNSKVKAKLAELDTIIPSHYTQPS